MGLDVGSKDGRGPREVVRRVVGCETRWDCVVDDRVRDPFAVVAWRRGRWLCVGKCVERNWRKRGGSLWVGRGGRGLCLWATGVGGGERWWGGRLG